jgi:hypothetical protein
MERASRVLVYGALVGLAVAAIVSCEITTALLLAALKALLVGLEYMELRHAHRAHAAAFVAWVVGLTLALVVAT